MDMTIDRYARATLLLVGSLLTLACGEDGTAGSQGGTDSSTDAGTSTGAPTTGAPTDPTTGDDPTTATSMSASDGTTTDPTTTGETTTTGVVPPTCGDGVVDDGEGCDDGNADNTDACLDTCQSASCGDGFVGPGEACDDGNAVDDDECSNGCAAASCGDGVVQAGEDCDDGNADDTDDCLATCVAASCGDGAIQAGVETCDDGNEVGTDACTASCQEAICGDGVAWEGMEECDAAGESAECDADCSAADCGDMVVNAAAGEACDDGNADNTDDCIDTCQAAACGDGFVQQGEEQCDDDNVVAGDGCSATCQLEACTWDIAKLPLPITVHAANYYGDIAFDKNCDLLVVAAFNDGLLRVNHTTGMVTTVVENFGTGSTNGVVYRQSNDRIYVATDSPSRLYSIEGNNPPVLEIAYPATVNAIAVAPMGFGVYGDQIVGVTTGAAVVAYDPAKKMLTTVGTGSGILSDLVFSIDGKTLYVANHTNNRVDTVTGLGQFGLLLGGLNQPDGLAVDSDGSRLFVAHFPNGSGRIDRVSLPGAVLSAGPAIALDGGFYTSGVLVDGADNVIYKSQVANNAVINAFKAP